MAIVEGGRVVGDEIEREPLIPSGSADGPAASASGAALNRIALSRR